MCASVTYIKTLCSLYIIGSVNTRRKQIFHQRGRNLHNESMHIIDKNVLSYPYEPYTHCRLTVDLLFTVLQYLLKHYVMLCYLQYLACELCSPGNTLLPLSSRFTLYTDSMTAAEVKTRCRKLAGSSWEAIADTYLHPSAVALCYSLAELAYCCPVL